MLTEVGDGVLVRQSEFCLSNAVVVRGTDGLLLIDPGVLATDLEDLAADVASLGVPVVAGLATHPHWDHVLWSEAFGDVPRYGTPKCVSTIRAELDDARGKAERSTGESVPPGFGHLTALVTLEVPWDGPTVEVREHQAHAPGHAATLVAGVVVAGDMLSDVEVPLLATGRGSGQLSEYVAGLDLLESLAGHATALVPGHGAVATGVEMASRFAADRAYVDALLAGVVPDDDRVADGAGYGDPWLRREHEEQVRAILG